MNFNIYIEDKLGEQLQKATEVTGKSKNALIREALNEWFMRHPMIKWPDEILQQEGVEGFTSFESSRDKFQPPKEDLFE